MYYIATIKMWSNENAYRLLKNIFWEGEQIDV